MVSEQQRILDSTHGRFSYILSIFLIFVVLNPVLNYVMGLIDMTPETQILVHGVKNGHSVYGASFDLLAYWYIKLPLFIHITYSRVTNAGLNKWLTLLFILPVINLLLWIWPPMKLKPNKENKERTATAAPVFSVRSIRRPNESFKN